MSIFRRLFEPTNIGPLSIQNRLVMPPMTTRYGNPDGTVSQRIKHYYKARAGGGAGLIIVEMACVSEDERTLPTQLAIWGDQFLPGLKALAGVIHAAGTRAFLQLQHGGREAFRGGNEKQAVAPSSIPGTKGVPRELTIPEIRELVRAFGTAALRAQAAGFDGVEFHGAHIYLIQQFLSPFANKRNDEYGGTVERRARFALEILQEARKRVGRDFPISFRINGDDFVDGGLTLDQSTKIARLLEEAGATCIHVSGGTVGSLHKTAQPGSEPLGCLVHLAAAIRKTVAIPVITVGSINDPKFADQILTEGKADLVAMGRALIADPELPNKAKGGRLADIRRCIRCCHCLAGMDTVTCAVNPAAGREGESIVLPAKKAKKIVVVGGGPAGLEAARIAASRGHSVTLYEEATSLGGQLSLAAIPPYKQEVANFTEFLVSQISKVGAKVLTGRKVTAEVLRQSGADVVILATGSSPKPLDIPGSHGSNVADARAVVAGSRTTGKKVVVVGGGQVGCETALLLHSQGKQVTIVEMLPEIARDVEPLAVRRFMVKWLQEAGIPAETECQVEEITKDGVVVATPGGRRSIEADTIVVAVGAVPNSELADRLKDAPFQVHLIGDAATPGKIADAVRQGFELGRAV